MKIERKCLTCAYAVKDPNATPDQIIQGTVPWMCLRQPPVSSPIVTGQGVAIMTAYPQVNPATVSCAEFKPTPEGVQ